MMIRIGNGLGMVVRESFRLLARDRVFAPAMISSFLLAVAANVVCFWTIEEFGKVLYDIGLLGFHVLGGSIALFWGVRSMSELKVDGAIESQLAWPVSRANWVLGKFIGLVLALLVIWFFAVSTWQVVIRLNGFRWMRSPEWAAFGGVLVGWWVVGALGSLLATVTGPALATFLGMVLWGTGLMSANIAHSMGVGVNGQSVEFVQGVARFWDLSQFNLSSHVYQDLLSPPELWARLGYGALLISMMITLACVTFSRRDV